MVRSIVFVLVSILFGSDVARAGNLGRDLITAGVIVDMLENRNHGGGYVYSGGGYYGGSTVVNRPDPNWDYSSGQGTIVYGNTVVGTYRSSRRYVGGYSQPSYRLGTARGFRLGTGTGGVRGQYLSPQSRRTTTTTVTTVSVRGRRNGN